MFRIIAGAFVALPLLPPASAQLASFGSGTFLIGVDIAPGLYRSRPAGTSCSWKRLSGVGGTADQIIAVELVSEGPALVEISSTDFAFHSSGCVDWKRVGRADSAIRYDSPARPRPEGATDSQPLGGREPPKTTYSSEHESIAERIQESERRLAESLLAEDGYSVAREWVSGLGFRHGGELRRLGDDGVSVADSDYGEQVVDGALTVTLFPQIASSWERMGCGDRRAELEELLKAFMRQASATAKEEGITERQVTGVEVVGADPESNTTRRLGVVRGSIDSYTVSSLNGCEPVTIDERETTRDGMSVAGINVGTRWVKGLGLKRNPTWLRDFRPQSGEGLLLVTFSEDLARSWNRLECGTRRARLEELFQAWERMSTSMWADGIARWKVRAVGVSGSVPGTGETESLGMVVPILGSNHVSGLTGCD